MKWAILRSFRVTLVTLPDCIGGGTWYHIQGVLDWGRQILLPLGSRSEVMAWCRNILQRTGGTSCFNYDRSLKQEHHNSIPNKTYRHKICVDRRHKSRERKCLEVVRLQPLVVWKLDAQQQHAWGTILPGVVQKWWRLERRWVRCKQLLLVQPKAVPRWNLYICIQFFHIFFLRFWRWFRDPDCRCDCCCVSATLPSCLGCSDLLFQAQTGIDFAINLMIPNLLSYKTKIQD